MPKETWRPIVGSDSYEVSNMGRVRSWIVQRSKRGSKSSTYNILRPATHPKGYQHLVLGSRKSKTRKTVKVHHLVLLSFVGPRPRGRECAHLDGDPKNNYLKNLAWVTPKENSSHKYIHKTMSCRLNNESVLLIRELASSGFRQSEISSLLLIKRPTINHIVNRKTWRHI